MVERRRYPRYKARILLKYKRLDEPIAKWQENPEIENISFGGLSFNAYERIPYIPRLFSNFRHLQEIL